MDYRDDSIPYAAIARLVEHVMQKETENWQERYLRRGPIANSGHIIDAATEVQAWLDRNLMTVWSQDAVDRDFQ